MAQNVKSNFGSKSKRESGKFHNQQNITDLNYETEQTKNDFELRKFIILTTDL